MYVCMYINTHTHTDAYILVLNGAQEAILSFAAAVLHIGFSSLHAGSVTLGP